jgi:hypothetical protein
MALPLFLLALFLSPARSSAQVAVYLVENTNDSGLGSLRQAIIDANGFGGFPTIIFVLPSYPETIALSSTLPEITNDMTITGPGADKLTISGNGAVRVLELAGDTDLVLENLTISNGFDAWAGAGIYSRHEHGDGATTLTIIDCVFSGNRTTDTPGEHRGGAIYFDRYGSSGLTITGSTFAYNEAHSNAAVGGAIYAYATVEITDSTFVGNLATPVQDWGIGSAVYLAGGSLSMTHCTVYDNTSSPGSGTAYQTGAIHVNSGTASLKNTIVADNPGGNCYGTFTDDGGNLQFGDTTCGCGIPVADPKLPPLADNGGPTPTMALPIDSPAADACACAATEGSAASTGASLTVDQRGEPRPYDWLSVDNGGACDSGAYEKQGVRLYLPLTQKAVQ